MRSNPVVHFCSTVFLASAIIFTLGNPHVAIGVADSSTTSSTVADSSTSSTIASSTNPCLDPANPEYVCGWAVLDGNNRVTGVIVCSFAVCGSGSFGGMRLVLQSQQMAGGNVAGWHGEDVKYDESSGSYTLPGGGTLKSGDRLEDAVYPKTVVTVTLPSGYESTEEYAIAETKTVMTSSLISIDLPVFQVRELDYEVSFDPIGAEPEFVVGIGKIVNELIDVDVRAQTVVAFRSDSTPIRGSSKIVVKRDLFKGRNGSLKVSLSLDGKDFAVIGLSVVVPKTYKTCRALVKDYPGGVVASTKFTDKKSRKRTIIDAAQPILNVRVFSLNRGLDFDRDKVICERNN